MTTTIDVRSRSRIRRARGTDGNEAERAPAGPCGARSVPRRARRPRLARCARRVAVAGGVRSRAGDRTLRSPGGGILARTILDKPNPVAAWKAATQSTFASRRGRNQPTLLVVDELLSRWGQAGVAETLRFTLRRWLATYSGSRATRGPRAARGARRRRDGVDRGPEVEAPAPVARPAAKYTTYGMMVSGLTKDLHNPLAYAGSEARSLQYRAAEHSRRYITTVEDGLLMQGGRPLDTGRAFIFVMDGDGTLYSASKAEVTHHSSFISGRPAARRGRSSRAPASSSAITGRAATTCRPRRCSPSSRPSSSLAA